MERNHRGNRLFRASLILVVLITGAAGAGLYYFHAGGNGQPSAAEGPSDAAAEQQGAAQETDQPDAEAAEASEDSGSEDEGKTAVPVRVVDATLDSVSTYITAAANLIPENEVKVIAEAEGRVTRLLVEEGDWVERGQLLAALFRDEAEIVFNKAQLKASNAEMAYQRASRMFKEELISREEYDKATMDHRIAQQELAESTWKLEKTEIRAPFDGRLTQRSITLGQHIRPGEELFVVTDYDPLIARVYLPERDVLSIKEGREVKITLKADENVQFRGRIRQISPVVDTSTGTVKVTVAAADPPSVVRPGGFVTIDIVRETHDDVLVLPRKAVIRELQKAHVFVARGDVAEKRSVTLGLEEDGRLEILSGVEAGERIVVAGQGSLKDGSTIKILPEDSQSQVSDLGGKKRRIYG